MLWSLTSIFRQFAAIDLVLNHVSPVEGALVEVEVQGDGVPQAGHQHTELTLIQVDATNLVPVGEDDKGLERVWRRRRTRREQLVTASHTYKSLKLGRWPAK